ncbi:MAG: hypothetical protein AAFU70_06145, partial [Planctomycetota bacterium]
ESFDETDLLDATRWFDKAARLGDPGLDDRFDATRAGDSFGRLHLRYNGDAIAVHLDGHAESFDETDLLDATRWFDKAARLGDPGWRLDLFRN